MKNDEHKICETCNGFLSGPKVELIRENEYNSTQSKQVIILPCSCY